MFGEFSLTNAAAKLQLFIMDLFFVNSLGLWIFHRLATNSTINRLEFLANMLLVSMVSELVSVLKRFPAYIANEFTLLVQHGILSILRSFMIKSFPIFIRSNT